MVWKGLKKSVGGIIGLLLILTLVSSSVSAVRCGENDKNPLTKNIDIHCCRETDIVYGLDNLISYETNDMDFHNATCTFQICKYFQDHTGVSNRCNVTEDFDGLSMEKNILMEYPVWTYTVPPILDRGIYKARYFCSDENYSGIAESSRVFCDVFAYGLPIELNKKDDDDDLTCKINDTIESLFDYLHISFLSVLWCYFINLLQLIKGLLTVVFGLIVFFKYFLLNYEVFGIIIIGIAVSFAYIELKFKPKHGLNIFKKIIELTSNYLIGFLKFIFYIAWNIIELTLGVLNKINNFRRI